VSPTTAGLALLSRAAARATAVAGTPIQVELSAEHVRDGADGHPRIGYALIAHFQDKGQAERAVEAIRRTLEDDAHRRDALLSTLGPHGIAAALPGLAWAWTQADGLRLHRTGSTPARGAADAWIQQTAERLAQGTWPLRPEDCASSHERLRRAEAGEWTGAAAALDAEWGWNRLLAGRRILQTRYGRAAVWHTPGLKSGGPPLVLAAAAW
jgi:hypothetical protein